MNDEQTIKLAESVGFRFHKLRNESRWSVIAPDEDGITCDQNTPNGMKWLREKLTHFLPDQNASCKVFTLCQKPATTNISHPSLGKVPACIGCATKIGALTSPA